MCCFSDVAMKAFDQLAIKFPRDDIIFASKLRCCHLFTKQIQQLLSFDLVVTCFLFFAEFLSLRIRWTTPKTSLIEVSVNHILSKVVIYMQVTLSNRVWLGECKQRDYDCSDADSVAHLCRPISGSCFYNLCVCFVLYQC